MADFDRQRKRQINFRLSERYYQKALALVEEGQHSTMSDFIESAIIRYLEEATIKREVLSDLIDFLKSPDGQKIIRDALREE